MVITEQNHSHGDTHAIRNTQCLLFIMQRKYYTYIQIAVIVNESNSSILTSIWSPFLGRTQSRQYSWLCLKTSWVY